MGLDEQIQQTSDVLELRNLVARLAQLADTGELDEYIQIFTEDASWESATLGTRRGHADILQGARERRASGVSGPGAHTLHVITTTSIQLAGDAATGQSYFLFYVNAHEAPELSIMGIYDDEFRRTPQGWKLARRVISSA